MKEKRGLLLLFLLLILPLIEVVSAYSGQYSSISNVFYAIGEENLTFAIVFIVSFLLINFALRRAFGPEQNTTAAVIAGALAIGGAYFSLKYGYSQAIGDFISGIGFNIGFGSDIMYPVIFFVALALLILLTVLTSISWALIILGVMMILLSSYAYESDLVTIIGIIMILIAIAIGWARHRWQNTMYTGGGVLGRWMGGRVMRPGIFGWGRRRTP